MLENSQIHAYIIVPAPEADTNKLKLWREIEKLIYFNGIFAN